MSNATPEITSALYQSGCLKFGTFTIKSGATSPYYIDLARLLSSPKDLCTVAEIAATKIGRIMTVDKIDKLASIELKGALLLPTIALKLGLPCVVVRKEDKAYGATGRITGADITKADRILFFDDVVSEGLSKLEGIKPLEQLGAQVKHIMVVVDREQGGRQNLQKLNYKVHALARISDVTNCLLESGSISKEQAEAILKYIRKS